MNIIDKPIDQVLGFEKKNEVEVIKPEKKINFDSIEDEHYQRKIQKSQKDFEDDFEIARENIMYVIDQSKNLFDQVHTIAKEKESFKEYEVLNNYLRTIGDASSVLLNLHERRKKFMHDKKQSDKVIDDKATNNTNIFIGSYADLQNAIKKIKDETK